MADHPRFGAYPVACRMYANEPEVELIPQARAMAERIRAAGGAALVDEIRAAQSDAPLLAAEARLGIKAPAEEPEAGSSEPEDDDAADSGGGELEDMTVAALRRLIADRGGEAPTSARKAELIDIALEL